MHRKEGYIETNYCYGRLEFQAGAVKLRISLEIRMATDGAALSFPSSDISTYRLEKISEIEGQLRKELEAREAVYKKIQDSCECDRLCGQRILCGDGSRRR